MVGSKGVCNLIKAQIVSVIQPTDCVAHCSDPSFDALTFEIWGALLNGARLVIVPQAVVLEATRFAALLGQHRTTVLWLTSGLFTQYPDALAIVLANYDT